MSGYTAVTDGGTNHDGTRLVRVQVGDPTGHVVFVVEASAAIRLGEDLVRAGRQGMGGR